MNLNNVTTDVLVIFAIALIVILGAAYSMWRLQNEGQKLFDEMDMLNKKARAAKTIPEINAAWEELVLLNKKCWHRNHVGGIREIRVILETKYEMLNEKGL